MGRGKYPVRTGNDFPWHTNRTNAYVMHFSPAGRNWQPVRQHEWWVDLQWNHEQASCSRLELDSEKKRKDSPEIPAWVSWHVAVLFLLEKWNVWAVHFRLHLCSWRGAQLQKPHWVQSTYDEIPVLFLFVFAASVTTLGYHLLRSIVGLLLSPVFRGWQVWQFFVLPKCPLGAREKDVCIFHWSLGMGHYLKLLIKGVTRLPKTKVMDRLLEEENKSEYIRAPVSKSIRGASCTFLQAVLPRRGGDTRWVFGVGRSHQLVQMWAMWLQRTTRKL